jgi:mRNA-binding protein PUF3
MLRFDRVDSVSSQLPQRGSMSSAADSLTEVPLLVSDAQSPQSSGLPSGNASAIEEPVHTTPTANKTITTSRAVYIANA